MNLSVPRRLLQAWLVLLTFVFSILAPSVTLAVSPEPAGVEICRASTPASGSKQTPAMAGMKHCLYCATHHSLPALPVAAASGLPARTGRDHYPRLYYCAASSASIWSAAYPRAPPAHA